MNPVKMMSETGNHAHGNQFSCPGVDREAALVRTCGCWLGWRCRAANAEGGVPLDRRARRE
eukprot:2844791-Pleurochrysis_carterae.AAC.1